MSPTFEGCGYSNMRTAVTEISDSLQSSPLYQIYILHTSLLSPPLFRKLPLQISTAVFKITSLILFWGLDSRRYTLCCYVQVQPSCRATSIKTGHLGLSAWKL